MRKLSNILLGLGLVGLLAACSSGPDAASDAKPQGNAPDTVQAPEGAKNPEERGMEEMRAAEGNANNSQFGSDQDGGGQDGK